MDWGVTFAWTFKVYNSKGLDTLLGMTTSCGLQNTRKKRNKLLFWHFHRLHSSTKDIENVRKHVVPSLERNFL